MTSIALSHCIALHRKTLLILTPFHNVTIPFFINGPSHHHPHDPEFTRASFLQVCIINCVPIHRIYIYFTIFSHFIHSHHTFFLTVQMPVLDRTTSVYLRRSSFVRSVCDVYILFVHCVSTRFCCTSSHFLPSIASIYDVPSFSPSLTGFLITCTRINAIISLHVFLYKLFPYSVQYSIVINR